MPAKLTAKPTPKCPACFGTGLPQDQVKIGQSMRTIRLAARRTMAEVAKKMKLSDSYICELERGNRRWTLELRTKFEAACK